VARLGGREDPELRHLRGPDHDEARLAQAPHQVRAVVGPVAGEELRPEVHAQAGHRDVRLDGDRHPREGPLVAGLDPVGGLQRAVGIDLHEGVHARVQVVDACERGGHDLPGRDLPAANQRGKLLDRLEHQVGGAHDGGGSLREFDRARDVSLCE
jgi:hypothetical protein